MKHSGILLMCLFLLACGTSSDTKSDTKSPQAADGLITAPRVVHRVEPDYPADLRRDGITGSVTIQGTISKTGQLLDPRVFRTTNPRLNGPALEAVRQWRFQPATSNGEPVEVILQVEVPFPIP